LSLGYWPISQSNLIIDRPMHSISPGLTTISVAIFFGFVQGCFILYFFLTDRRYKGHLLFLGFIAILMLNQIESFLLRSSFIMYVPHFVNISTPFLLLIGPLLYRYIFSVPSNNPLPRRSLIHFLPFLTYFIYSFNYFLQPTGYKYNSLVAGFRPDLDLVEVQQHFSSDPWGVQGWVVVEGIAFHFLLYSIACFYYLLKRSSSAGKHGKDRGVPSRSWYLFLTSILTLGAGVLFFSQGGVINGQVLFVSPFPHFSPELFSTGAMYLITGYLLAHAHLFGSRSKKYKKSALSKSDIKQKLVLLKSAMENDQPYLSSQFSLTTLAQKTGLSKHHISQITNEELGCTFFEFTNRYRVQEAKRRLDSSDDFIKLEQLAYDLGYKSKSTLYAAFKRETGLTPAKYREVANNESKPLGMD